MKQSHLPLFSWRDLSLIMGVKIGKLTDDLGAYLTFVPLGTLSVGIRSLQK